MKTLLCLLFAFPLLANAQSNAVAYKPQSIVLPAGVDVEKVKDLANEAVAQLADEFSVQTAALQSRRFAVLPLKRDVDDGYVSMQLQNRLSTAGVKAGVEIYTRDNATLNSLLSEIQWGQDFGDTMDPATIQKFGRITGVQGIIFSRLDVTTGDLGAITVRVNMQAYEVETGRALWGAEKKAVQAAKITPKTAIQEAKDVVEGSRPYWKIIAYSLLGLLIFLWLLAKVRRASRPR
jgi:hypothetical protein